MSPSSAALLLVRPFRGYEALASETREDAPTIAGGAFRLLLVIGAVVAITATGRLAPVELFIAAVSFAYVPVIQLIALAAALRVVARTTPVRRAFALYLAGHGPWLVAMLLVAAVCLLAPAPAGILFALFPPLVGISFLWSTVLTFACFRRGLGLARARAAIATAVHVLVLTALVVAYFLGMNQLGPLWR